MVGGQHHMFDPDVVQAPKSPDESSMTESITWRAWWANPPSPALSISCEPTMITSWPATCAASFVFDHVRMSPRVMSARFDSGRGELPASRLVREEDIVDPGPEFPSFGDNVETG